MSSTTCLIPNDNLAHLEEGVAALNKRCRRLGLTEITIEKAQDHTRGAFTVLDSLKNYVRTEWKRPEEAKVSDCYVDSGERQIWWSVTVTGESPKLNGWEFIAVLEPLKADDGTTLNFIQCVPGKECPTAQRDRINVCDHCNAKRRRSQTFVVRNIETNEFKSVGRQCLKDFLGYHESPEALINQAELLASLGGLLEECGNEDGCSGSRREYTWSLEAFLTWTACRIRLFGWLTSRHAFSTRDIVLSILTPPRSTGDAYREWKELVAQHEVNDGDRETAAKAIEWARSFPNEQIKNNDYLANCNLVARVGSVIRKTSGVAASIVSSYQREVEKELNRQKWASRPESHHVGTIGQRIILEGVTCERVISNETSWGTTGIHKIVTAEGSDLTWFASQSAEWLEANKTYNIQATVKSHGDYKGRLQTVLNRVQILSDEELAAAKAKEAKKAAAAAKKAAKALVTAQVAQA